MADRTRPVSVQLQVTKSFIPCTCVAHPESPVVLVSDVELLAQRGGPLVATRTPRAFPFLRSASGVHVNI